MKDAWRKGLEENPKLGAGHTPTAKRIAAEYARLREEAGQ